MPQANADRNNRFQQCGHNISKEVTAFTLIKGPLLAGKKQKVIKVGAGISFSLCLTDDGKGQSESFRCPMVNPESYF
jgi:hypothetical protein